MTILKLMTSVTEHNVAASHKRNPRFRPSRRTGAYPGSIKESRQGTWLTNSHQFSGLQTWASGLEFGFGTTYEVGFVKFELYGCLGLGRRLAEILELVNGQLMST